MSCLFSLCGTTRVNVPTHLIFKREVYARLNMSHMLLIATHIQPSTHARLDKNAMHTEFVCEYNLFNGFLHDFMLLCYLF